MEAQRQTVLIVDDTPANIKILSEALDDACKGLFGTNGQDALNSASDDNPDLSLLDVRMPEMDGYEVCTRLKPDARTRRIPVVFGVALDQEVHKTRRQGFGAIDHITKPVRLSMVQARMRKHLELKRYGGVLENLPAIDGLTGIANRRRFDEAPDAE